ncbi:GNAT family N-acetyltransferase [Natrialbaceae archaeon A-CW3]
MPNSQDVTLEICGWPPNGPRLRLHHERFSYAGKFVMSNTGKAVARVPDTTAFDIDHPAGKRDPADTTTDLPYQRDVVAAVAFNEDRTDPSTLWLRYVTVDRAVRGQGLGPRLIAFVRDAALDRGYDGLKIAVNNPYAYDALWKAGFGFTGETTGLAELVLVYPSESAEATYRRGLEQFSERDLTDDERSFLERRLEDGPPGRPYDADPESDADTTASETG